MAGRGFFGLIVCCAFVVNPVTINYYHPPGRNPGPKAAWEQHSLCSPTYAFKPTNLNLVQTLTTPSNINVNQTHKQYSAARRVVSFFRYKEHTKAIKNVVYQEDIPQEFYQLLRTFLARPGSNCIKKILWDYFRDCFRTGAR